MVYQRRSRRARNYELRISNLVAAQIVSLCDWTLVRLFEGLRQQVILTGGDNEGKGQQRHFAVYRRRAVSARPVKLFCRSLQRVGFESIFVLLGDRRQRVAANAPVFVFQLAS